MPCCCVPRCTNRSETKKKGTDGITFHLFPRDVVKRRRWSAAVGRDGWRPSSASVVCSRHFPAACFYRTRGGLVRLLDYSLPVLHVPPAQENISDSPWEPKDKCEDGKSMPQKELELDILDTKNESRGALHFTGNCEDRRRGRNISKKCEDINSESRDAVQISEKCEDENSKSRGVVELTGNEGCGSPRRPAVLRVPCLEPGAPAKARALAAHVRRMQQLLKKQRKSIRQLQQCLRERRATLRGLQCPTLRDVAGDGSEGLLQAARETSDCDDQGYHPCSDTLDVSLIS